MTDCTHHYKNKDVTPANSTGTDVMEHPVCVKCGHDQMDNAYRCIDCGDLLKQWQIDFIQNKCDDHRQIPDQAPTHL
jgi:tRNA(Ile2) C34 agmatinyltransferase TiaS